MGKHLPQTVSEFKVHCIVSVHTTHTHAYKLAGLVLAMFMEGVGDSVCLSNLCIIHLACPGLVLAAALNQWQQQQSRKENRK